MLTLKLRDDTEDIITAFVRGKMQETKASSVAIGMSGGLDSTVVAYLCVRALGKENVLGVMMPERQSSPQDLEHGIMVAKKLGIEQMVVDISDAVDAFTGLNKKFADRLSVANIKARCRMIVLYNIANATNKIVMGCGNKTELMMGYFTKFGDGAADYLPIGDLYKTQVRELAKRIGVPGEILSKAPSAGLWKDQTDEGEMGITYDLLDKILYGLEMGLRPEEIAKKATCDLSQVSMVSEKMRQTVHKRRLPQIPKIGLKTPGFDWREY